MEQGNIHTTTMGMIDGGARTTLIVSYDCHEIYYGLEQREHLQYPSQIPQVLQDAGG
jgi:hypothetical protein